MWGWFSCPAARASRKNCATKFSLHELRRGLQRDLAIREIWIAR
jgi:hypothetical protein